MQERGGESNSLALWCCVPIELTLHGGHPVVEGGGASIERRRRSEARAITFGLSGRSSGGGDSGGLLLHELLHLLSVMLLHRGDLILCLSSDLRHDGGELRGVHGEERRTKKEGNECVGWRWRVNESDATNRLRSVVLLLAVQSVLKAQQFRFRETNDRGRLAKRRRVRLATLTVVRRRVDPKPSETGVCLTRIYRSNVSLRVYRLSLSVEQTKSDKRSKAIVASQQNRKTSEAGIAKRLSWY